MIVSLLFALNLAHAAPQATCEASVQARGRRGTVFKFKDKNRSEKLTYLGKYGELNYAWSGDHLRLLTDREMVKYELSSEGSEFPAVLKQSTDNNCDPASIAYLQTAYQKDLMMNALTPVLSPLTGNPFLTWMRSNPWITNTEATMQEQLIEQTFRNLNISYRKTDSSKEVIAAALAHKKVMIGVTATQGRQWIDDSALPYKYKSIPILEPYGRGETGHSMVIVDAYKDRGEIYLILADFSSGSLIVTSTYNGVPGLQDAYILD